MNFEAGKVAVVTGAASGIGLALAEPSAPGPLQRPALIPSQSSTSLADATRSARTARLLTSLCSFGRRGLAESAREDRMFVGSEPALAPTFTPM
jgi:hypothetical protein